MSTVASKAFWNLVLAYVSLFYFGLVDNIRGPLYPEILDNFALKNDVGTWFFALASGTAILSGSLFPWLSHRIGTYWAFMTGVAACVLSQFVFALAPSFSWILFGSWLLGMGIGFIGVAQNVLVLTAASPKHMTRLMNGLHANYAASSLIAPLIVAVLYHYTQSFRFPFLALGLMGLLCLVYFLKSRQVLEVGEAEGFSVQTHHLEAKHIYFAVVLSAYVVGEVLLSTRLAQYMRDTYSSSLEVSAYWTTSFFVGLFVGRLLFSFLVLPFAIRSQLITGLLGSAFSFALSILISPWFFILVGVSMAPCYALIMSWMKEGASSSLRVATTAAIVSSGVFIVVMHLLAGVLTDWYGVSFVMWGGVIFLILSFMLVLADKWFLGVGHSAKNV